MAPPPQPQQPYPPPSPYQGYPAPTYPVMMAPAPAPAPAPVSNNNQTTVVVQQQSTQSTTVIGRYKLFYVCVFVREGGMGRGEGEAKRR